MPSLRSCLLIAAASDPQDPRLRRHHHKMPGRKMPVQTSFQWNSKSFLPAGKPPARLLPHRSKGPSVSRNFNMSRCHRHHNPGVSLSRSHRLHYMPHKKNAQKPKTILQIMCRTKAAWNHQTMVATTATAKMATGGRRMLLHAEANPDGPVAEWLQAQEDMRERQERERAARVEQLEHWIEPADPPVAQQIQSATHSSREASLEKPEQGRRRGPAPGAAASRRCSAARPRKSKAPQGAGYSDPTPNVCSDVSWTARATHNPNFDYTHLPVKSRSS